MKIVKTIFLTIIALVVVLGVVGLLLPGQTYVERSTVINAPASVVFPLVNNFQEFNKWSPWAKRDPEAQYTFAGPESGVGAKFTWSSDNPQVGVGSQEIIESELNKKVRTFLDFGDMGTAYAQFTLEAVEEGVALTWGFDVEHGWQPVKRYFGLMMDKWVGKDYEEGLADLKRLAESLPAQAAVAMEVGVLSEEISYASDGAQLTGYLAYPNDGVKRPGVLVIHEWWGHNDYVRKRADMLAKLGYAAFALDMYGDGKVTAHPEDAGKFMTEVKEKEGRMHARFNAALDLFKAHSAVEANRIAAIGYCFGGGVALNMARSGMDLKGVVSFHSSIGELMPIAETASAKVLVLNGADDPWITEEHKQAFKAEMDAGNMVYEFIDYPGVVHSFTNPAATALGEEFNLPIKYDAAADADSWQRMQVFLKEIFK